MGYGPEGWSSNTYGNDDIKQVGVCSLGLTLGFRAIVRVNTNVRVRINVKANSQVNIRGRVMGLGFKVGVRISVSTPR